MKKLLTGNEAIAQGAFEAGCVLATGYPGTPATEIIETLLKIAKKSDELYVEWSANEKTALEMASGASFAGRRTLVAMKHVGLNAAADPLMTLAYTGVGAGLVIAVSDDPGMHSSQNEQDSRLYARMARIPLLEPSDSAEALQLTKEAFRISERFDLPVIVRLTAAVSHSESPVVVGKRTTFRTASVKKLPEKYVMLPPFCNKRRLDLEKRLKRLRAFSETFRFNRIEHTYKASKFGIIASGVSYLYAKEACPEAPILKLAMTYPLPISLIRKFSATVQRLFVIEELESFMEDEIMAEGIEVIGKRQGLPVQDELSVPIIRQFLKNKKPSTVYMPKNGASLCTGCPYLGIFYHISRLGCYVFGDIGCYTLAARVFPGSIDTTLCMGAGISQAAGFIKTMPTERAISVIGDSTFFHSGLPAVVNAVHHKAPITIVVLNNKVTAMTGGQPHAGTNLNIKNILKACGLRDIKEVSAYDMEKIKIFLSDLLALNAPSALIVNGPCAVRAKPSPMTIEKNLCNRCLRCLGIKCPSISEDDGYPAIKARCIGCGLCAALCPKGAIR